MTVNDLIKFLTKPDDDIDLPQEDIGNTPVKFAASASDDLLELLSIYDWVDDDGNVIICIDIG